MLLALVKIAVSRSGGEALRAFGLLLRAGALGLLEAAVFSCVIVALSSLMKRRGLVQGAFAALIFLPWMIGGKFRDFTRTPWPALGSIPTHLESLAQFLFGVPNEIGSRAMPPWIALGMLGVIAAASVWVAWRQLRRVEVIAG
jgi:hypothetical protein